MNSLLRDAIETILVSRNSSKHKHSVHDKTQDEHCIKCRRKCASRGVFCTEGNHWVHYNCLKLNEKEILSIEKRDKSGNPEISEYFCKLCADFYQLPPIKDKLYGDLGHYCFQANFFQDMFPHIIQLTTVHRQSDKVLISCINELEKGKPSAETNAFMNFLSRPLSAEYGSKCN